MRYLSLAALAISVGCLDLDAQTDSAAVSVDRTPPFFYSGGAAGSDAVVGPIHLLLNKGYQTAQVMNQDRRIFSYPYAWRHVFESLGDPVGNLRRSSWRTLEGEFYPAGFDIDRWDFWPNYFGHVLEGGIAIRQVSEWYRARGAPLPKVLGGLTGWTAAVLNEAYEHPGIDRGWASTTLDLYVFDIVGILLFSSDDVSRFFSQRLGATVWGRQPVLLPSGELHNNGEDLVFKIPVGIESARFFMRTGLGNHLGASFRRARGIDISVGVGAEVRYQTLDRKAGSEGIRGIVPSLGLFVDRRNSLLASAVVTTAEDRWVTLNAYPGAVRAGVAVGWFSIVGRRGVRLGLGLARLPLPGFGLLVH